MNPLRRLIGEITDDSVFNTSIAGKYENDVPLRQAEITAAIRPFMELTWELMNPRDIKSYINKSLAKTKPSSAFDINRLLLLVRMARVTGYHEVEAHTFKREKLEEMISMLSEIPFLVLSVRQLEKFIHEFLQSKIDSLSDLSEAEKKKLQVFRSHFHNTSNFLPKITAGIVSQMQPNDSKVSLWSTINQDAIDRGFRSLEKKGAFQYRAQNSTSDAVCIQCPVQSFLKAVIVESGCLASIIEYYQNPNNLDSKDLVTAASIQQYLSGAVRTIVKNDFLIKSVLREMDT